MKKIFYLLILVLLTAASCNGGDPMDPAKGIDSQGETTVFTGTVSVSGTPTGGQTVYCYNVSYSGTTGSLRWSAVTSFTTGTVGEYYMRDDLSAVYSGRVRLICNGTTKDIYEDGSSDITGGRTSDFNPVIITDF